MVSLWRHDAMKRSAFRTCEFTELLSIFLFPYLKPCRDAHLQLRCGVLDQSVCVCVFVSEPVFEKRLNVFMLTSIKIPSFSQDTRLLCSHHLSLVSCFLCVCLNAFPITCITINTAWLGVLHNFTTNLLQQVLAVGQLKGRQSALFYKIHFFLFR